MLTDRHEEKCYFPSCKKVVYVNAVETECIINLTAGKNTVKDSMVMTSQADLFNRPRSHSEQIKHMREITQLSN